MSAADLPTVSPRGPQQPLDDSWAAVQGLSEVPDRQIAVSRNDSLLAVPGVVEHPLPGRFDLTASLTRLGQQIVNIGHRLLSPGPCRSASTSSTSSRARSLSGSSGNTRAQISATCPAEVRPRT